MQDGRQQDLLRRRPSGHSRPLIYGVSAVVTDGDKKTSPSWSQVAKTTNFTVYGAHLEVYGICPSCRADKEGDHGE